MCCAEAEACLNGALGDWVWLVSAFNRGGATVVPCPAVRCSLVRAGLMTAAPSVRGHRGTPAPFMLALTKQGRLRAEQIVRQQSTPVYERAMRRLVNGAVHGNPSNLARQRFKAGFYGPGRW